MADIQNTLSPHTSSQAANAGLSTLRNSSLEHTLRRENTSLAYLLGAWATLTETGCTESGRISYASRERAQVELIKNELESLLSYAPTPHTVTIGGRLYHRIELRHEELAKHIYATTNHNNRIPWEHLGTKQECASFLRGVFDHGGWVFAGRSASIGIGKKDGHELLVDMTRVFIRIDLRPLIAEGEVTRLKLRERTEWSHFTEVVGASLGSRKQELKELCATPAMKNHFTVEDFRAVVACVQSGIDTPSDISRLTTIPANTVRDWLYRGQMPPVMKRQMAINENTKHLPHNDVINYIYRDLGGSSALAREFAVKMPLPIAKDRIERSAGGLSAMYGDDKKIRSALSPKPGADIFHPNRK